MSKGEKALECLSGFGKLDEKGYTELIKNDVGAEIIMVFEKYCQGIAPDAEASVLNTLVHLMITGYLVRTNEGKSIVSPSKIIQP